MSKKKRVKEKVSKELTELSLYYNIVLVMNTDITVVALPKILSNLKLLSEILTI